MTKKPGPIPPTFVDWTAVRHSGGGMVALYDVPASPLYSGLTFTYRDEADFDDRIPENPGYSDEDHAAYGNVGVRITGIADCNINPIRMVWRVYPTCAGVGDAVLGDGYHQFLDYPFQTPVVPQWKEAGPVRTLRLRRDAADVVLDWQRVVGAPSYLVYTAAWPDLPVISWTLLGETADPGGASRRAEGPDRGRAALPDPVPLGPPRSRVREGP